MKVKNVGFPPLFGRLGATQRYRNGRRLQIDWRSGCPPIMME